MRTTQFHFNQAPATPPLLRQLLIATCAVAIGLPVADSFLALFGYPSWQAIFCLTPQFFRSFYIWQPLTYLFVLQPAGPVTLSLLIGVAFRAYLLWMIGGTIIDRFGIRPFTFLYFASALFTAIVFLSSLMLTGNFGILYGNTAPLLALFVLWAMMNPEGMVFLFFVIPIKVKWLLAGIVGIVTLLNLSEGNGTHLLADWSGILFGYLYATMRWGMRTPFAFMDRIDTTLERWGDAIRYRRPRPGKQEKDDAFLDAMLEKISQGGEKALTWWEKWRLSRISRNKK